jgi:hypothetical protein
MVRTGSTAGSRTTMKKTTKSWRLGGNYYSTYGGVWLNTSKSIHTIAFMLNNNQTRLDTIITYYPLNYV